jgi:hypothetical protein
LGSPKETIEVVVFEIGVAAEEEHEMKRVG